MKESILHNYVLDLLTSIEQNISAYTKDKEPECLHRLRVDIKKIAAIFSFAEKIYKQKDDATKLKPLFHDAGKIREIQINLQLLSAISDPPERLITRLKNEEDILVQEFIENAARYISAIKEFQEHTCLPAILPGKKRIIAYFKKERRKANKIINHKDRESMHRYRKRIKRLMYLYLALPKKVQNKIELNEAEINEQQKMLGSWHDTYTAINFISLEPFSKQTSGYISKLKEKEEKQFDRLFNVLTCKRKRKRH